jgi:hypothetical protein
MRLRWLAGLCLLFAGGSFVQAQPAKPVEPTIEVRLRSVDDLVEKAVYIGKLVGQEDAVMGVKQLVKNLSAEGQGLEGVDPKRPFGLYASFDTDVVNSPFTVMIPIASKDRFLQMLKERLDLVPEKGEGGTLKVKVPDPAANPVIDALVMRFENDYLYIGRTAKDLDPKNLITPKAFFKPDDTAVASLLVRMDRIPNEAKTFVIGQMELAIAEQKNMVGTNPVEKAAFAWVSDTFVNGMKSLVDDSKTISAKLFIDEKTDEFMVEATLTPKSGTTMAKYFSSLASQTSLPAGIASAKDTIVRGSAKLTMPQEMKKLFGELIDTVVATALKEVNNEQERDLAKRVFDTLTPTLKAAEIDAAASLLAPDAKGRPVLIGAAAIKNGKEIEKLVKDLAPFAGNAAKFTFDIETIAGYTLHKVEPSDVPPELEKFFGTKTIWLALSDNIAAFSIESDGAVIKSAVKNKGIAVPVFMLELSAARLLPLVAQELKPDEVKAILKETFGDASPTGKDTVSVTITGGDSLAIRAKMKGKVIQLIMASGAIKPN